MTSVKLKITNSEECMPELQDYFRQYGNLLRWSYNRFADGLSVQQVYRKSKELNNLEKLNASFKELVVFHGKEIFDTNGPCVIFGGKKNFWDVKFGRKDKCDAIDKNSRFRCIGHAQNKGNRRFNFDLTNNKVVFKPEKGVKVPILFSNPSKNQKELLIKAQTLANKKELPICVTTTKSHIIFAIDETILKPEKERNFIKNRILSIDSNPNFIGVVVKDFDADKIIHKQIFDFREINVKNINKNKKHHEIFSVAKTIANIAKHYQCEIVGLEKLKIESKDKKKGKNFNRLTNGQWNRTIFFNNLKKWLNIYDIKYQEVVAGYSSYIGQLTNPEETDCIAAAIEIGRRTNLFNRIYIREDMEKTNIVYPELSQFVDSLPTRWKEMAKSRKWKTWKPLIGEIKKSGSSYRFSFDDWFKVNHKSFSRHKSIKSKVSTVVC